jgi:ribosomal protein L11 methyltransferase
MKWVEITIKTTTEQVEVVSDILYDIGVQGGTAVYDPADIKELEKEPGSWDFIDESIYQQMDKDGVLVKGYIADDENVQDKLAFVDLRINEILEVAAEFGEIKLLPISIISDEDWVENWKKHFKTTKVGERLVIKPSWETYEPKDDELVIQIDPGMAFGTGTHETTMLCMRELEKYVHKGQTVLDVGCGTAILAISAILLGAEYAEAVDIDDNAVRVAKENAGVNGVNEKMKCDISNLFENVTEGIQADIVIANIIADIVIKTCGMVKTYLKKDGIFITSGIILDRIADVEQGFKDNEIEHLYTIKMGEWAVVVGKNA